MNTPFSTQNPPTKGTRYLLGKELVEIATHDYISVGLSFVDQSHGINLKWDKFNELITQGKLKFHSESASIENPILALEALDEDTRERQEIRIFTAEYLLNNCNGKVTAKDLINLQSEFKVRGWKLPSRSSIQAWMKTYRETGWSTASLIDRYCRPSSRQKRVDLKIHTMAEELIENLYFSKRRLSQQLIYDSLEVEIRKYNLEHGTDLKVPGKTFIHRLISQRNSHRAMATRYGPKTAKRLFHAGPATRPADYLLQRVEADSNFMDILLVNEDGEEIGRPCLTLLLDVFSRCVLGWKIDLSAPSGVKTIQALEMALDRTRPTIIGGKPHTLLVDSGSEFANKHLKDVCQRLGIVEMFTEPGEPNQKPHVERFFGTMNTMFLHNLPGTTYSRPADRGDKKRVIVAQLSLEELIEKFGVFLDHYHHKTHSELGKQSPIGQFQCGLVDSPAQRFDPADLRRFTMKTFEATITSAGRVRHLGLQWSSGQLQNLRIGPSGVQRSVKVKVMFDPFDLLKVYVIDPNQKGNLIQCEAVRPWYQAGLTLFVHEQIRKETQSAITSYPDTAATEFKEKFLAMLIDGAQASTKKQRRKVEKAKDNLAEAARKQNKPNPQLSKRAIDCEEDESNTPSPKTSSLNEDWIEQAPEFDKNDPREKHKAQKRR